VGGEAGELVEDGLLLELQLVKAFLVGVIVLLLLVLLLGFGTGHGCGFVCLWFTGRGLVGTAQEPKATNEERLS
jgi:hypothetical protein